MKSRLLILSFCFIALTSCTPDEPCPTCFEDIVRCKVNGKKWVSNCKSDIPFVFGCSSVGCYYYYYEEKSLNLSARNDDQNSGISIDQSSRWGGAQLGNNSIQQREFSFGNSLLKGNCSRLDSVDLSYENYFILDKIDTINYFIIGKFGFRSFNLCGDTVTITDGYFKTKFKF